MLLQKGWLQNIHTKSLFRIALLAQAVLGILFFVCAFPKLQQTETVRIWELSARTSIRDDYMGIVYPALIQFAFGLQTRFFIPYYMVMYTIQVLALALSSFAIATLHCKEKGRWQLFLLLVTCPPLSRAAVTISPAIFHLVVYLQLVSIFLWAIRNKADKRKKLFIAGFVIMTLYVLLLGVGKVGVVKGSYGRVHKSVSSNIFVSFMGNHTEEKLGYLEGVFPETEEYRVFMTEMNPDQIRGTFGARADELLGAEADAYFRKASAKLFAADPFEIVGSLLVKLIRVVFSPMNTAHLSLWVLYYLMFGITLMGFFCKVDLKVSITPAWKKRILAGAAAVVAIAAAGMAMYSFLQSRAKTGISGRAVVLGDSIWGLVQDETGIATLLEQETNLQVDNLAIPGAAVCYEDDNVINRVNSLEVLFGAKMREETLARIRPKEADYIILAYGLNDYFDGNKVEQYGMVLGETIDCLMQQNPKLRIILIAPTQCIFYENGVLGTEGSRKSIDGNVLSDFSQKAKEVAQKKQILLIDMMEEMTYSRYDGEKYLLDGTHLTEFGRKKYAKIVTKQIDLYY